MRAKKTLFSKILFLSFFGFSIFPCSVQASSSGINQTGNGSVTVTDSGKSDLIDPENPSDFVDPGEGPSTVGELRIDFISELRFGLNKIESKNRNYSSLAQLFHSDTGARGYYIQVTDRRENSSGWELQLIQETQFTNSVIQEKGEKDLAGSTLSFDKGWANSPGTSTPPSVTRDAISIDEMGAAYTVALAGKNEGIGIWTIEFGASETNSNGKENTLAPLLDEQDKAVVNQNFNKSEFTNSAIQLTIPDTTKIHPVNYSTTLTWVLTVGPS